MSTRIPWVAVAWCACALCHFSDAANCPPSPATSVGEQKDLPVSGWFIFHRGFDDGAFPRGLYWVSLKDWSTRKRIDDVGSVRETDISPDGRWVLFSTGADCYLLRPDGAGKVKVPVTISTDYNQGKAQFVRNSHYGNEIFYNKGDDLEAIQVDLSGETPAFGAKRLLAKDIKGKDPSGNMSTFNGEMTVNGNHIYARVGNTGRHITIPDGGKGTATNSSMHPLWERYGCGLGVSPDGKLVVTNSAGSLDECGPPQHKGFIIGDFMEYNHYTGISKGIEWVEQLGKTINWCPEEYRKGSDGKIISYKSLEYMHWFWGNHDEYIIGSQRGSSSPLRDLWVVNRKTNVWTRVTFTDIMTLDEPALWIEDAGTTTGSSGLRAFRPERSGDTGRYYTLGGRLIARCGGGFAGRAGHVRRAGAVVWASSDGVRPRAIVTADR